LIGGDLLSLYVHRHHDYRSLGASGAVSGVIFAHIFLFPGGSIMPGIFLPIPIPSWLFAILFLVGSFYGMQRRSTNVGHDAHLGGALVGLFTATAFHPRIIQASPWLFGTISVGTALLFVYMARNPLFLPMSRLDFTRTPSSGRFSLRPILDFSRWRKWRGPVEAARPDRRVDALLQKISDKGINSLTAEERKLLDEYSVKSRRRAVRRDPKMGFPI
jgi:hypothetical protein